MENCFAKNAKKLALAGLTPIPVYPKNKIPSIDNWQNQPFDENWIQKFPGHNIGLRCEGELTVVDIDFTKNENQKAYDYLDKMLPKTPYVVTRGGREKRFYRSESLISTKLHPIEIFKGSGQVVIPPSIHPSGENYCYQDLDLAEIESVEDLPELDLSIEMFKIFKERFFPGKSGGRRNDLINQIVAGRESGKTKEEIYNEIWSYDQRNHNYFSIDKEWPGNRRKLSPEDRCKDLIEDFYKNHDNEIVLKIGTEEKKIEPPFPQQFTPLIDELEKHFNAPKEFYLVSLLSSLSSLIGNSIQVEIKKGWRQPGFIWGLNIGHPGITKTPIANFFKKPLIEIEKDINRNQPGPLDPISLVKIKHLKKMFDDAIKASIKKPSEEAEEEIKKIQQQIEEIDPYIPPNPSLLIQDITTSSLVDALKATPRSLHADYDELSHFMELCKGTYSIGLRQMFLLLNNGIGAIKKKVKEGEIFIEDAGLSVLANTQPDVIEKYFGPQSKYHIADGFLERFQLVAFSDFNRPKPISPTDMNMDLIEKFYEKMLMFYGNGESKKVYPFHETAKRLFFELEYEIQEQKSLAKSPYLTSCLGKAPNLVARLSLLFLIIEKVFEGSTLEQIQERHVEKAKEVFAWQCVNWEKIGHKFCL